MLSVTEAKAHLHIITVVNHSIKLGLDVPMGLVWKELEAFAPRCNCRRVLKFGPWREGSRFVGCVCGRTYLEARIWQGVPPVPKAAP